MTVISQNKELIIMDSSRGEFGLSMEKDEYGLELKNRVIYLRTGNTYYMGDYENYKCAKAVLSAILEAKKRGDASFEMPQAETVSKFSK